jgi:hypothetical protein
VLVHVPLASIAMMLVHVNHHQAVGEAEEVVAVAAAEP